MVSIIKLIALVVNKMHDILNFVLRHWMSSLTDKDLHFIIIGIFGLFIFIFTDYIFRKLSKLNISIISIIYTFTVLVVIVFSIEIEQQITKRGNMEFADIVAGLWGSVVIIGTYILLRILFYLIKSKIRRHDK